MSVAKNCIYFDGEAKKQVNAIAMLVLMVSFTMLFATLFLGYAVYRSSAEVWPPMGMQRISLFLPTMNTIVLIFSSLAYCFYQKAYSEKSWLKARQWWLATALLGVVFVILQFRLWGLLKTMGILVNTSIFSSMIYGFTWIHAAHMFGGLLALLYLFPTFRGSKRNFDSRVSNVGKFWHFLGGTWLVMYLGLFVF